MSLSSDQIREKHEAFINNLGDKEKTVVGISFFQGRKSAYDYLFKDKPTPTLEQIMLKIKEDINSLQLIQQKLFEQLNIEEVE